MTDIYRKYGHCAPKAGSQVAKGQHTTVFKNRLAADPSAAIPIKEPVSVAVKEFALPSCSGNDDAKEVQLQALDSFVSTIEETVINEVKPHPNVARLYGVEVVDGKVSGGGLDRIILTMDWIEKMEWPKTIKSPSGGLPEAVVQVAARSLIEGLCHLHSHGVTHDDLRPQNLLITRILEESNGPMDGVSAFRAVLTDYAIVRPVRVLLDPSSGMATTKQKPHYCAPEVFTSGGDYDAFKVDVWGVGATILELLSGKLPYSELDPSGKGNLMFKIIQARAPPKYPEGISAAAKSFLDSCFTIDFEGRPSVETLKEHDWIATP